MLLVVAGERTVRKVVSSFNNLSLKMAGSGKDPNNLDKLLKLKSDPERDVMVLILSVIGVTFPQDIAPPTARLVASTLLYHLNYGNEIFAGLAAELIGKGFALWRPHIPRLAGLIRRLLTLALYAEFHGGTACKYRWIRNPRCICSSCCSTCPALKLVRFNQCFLFLRLGKKCYAQI